MEILAGKITHYYKSIGVAALDVSDYLEIGNIIHIKGHTTDFEQKIESMQIEHKQITKAEKSRDNPHIFYYQKVSGPSRKANATGQAVKLK